MSPNPPRLRAVDEPAHIRRIPVSHPCARPRYRSCWAARAPIGGEGAGTLRANSRAGADAEGLAGMRIEPAAAVRGDVRVPGDKSISHRALLVGAVANGESEVRGFGASADTLATADAMRSLGATVEISGETVHIQGVGLGNLAAARRADRLPQRGHAHPAPLRPRRRPAGPLRADRGRVALHPPARARRRAAPRDGRARRDDRRPRADRDRAATASTRSATSCRSRAPR